MERLIAVLAVTRTGPRVFAGLAGLACLAIAIWPVDASVPQTPSPASLPSVPARSSDSDSAIQRPLFDPQRRAWTAQGTLADLDATPARPVLRVRGILVGDGVARALIEVEGAGDPVWLSRGDGRGDWRLAEIAAGQVSIHQEGHSFALPFLGEPATLRPARRRRVPVGETSAPVAVPAAEPSGPPLRLATEAGRTPVRTIPIVPQR